MNPFADTMFSGVFDVFALYGPPAVLLMLFAVYLKTMRPRRRVSDLRKREAVERGTYRYRAYPVLNAAERRVWADLDLVVHDHFPERARVLAQVSLPEFVETGSESDFRAINGKRVDFLVVDPAFRPICAIEYQGAGHYGWSDHSRARTVERDSCKRRALRMAGVPLVEIPERYDLSLLSELLYDVTGCRGRDTSGHSA